MHSIKNSFNLKYQYSSTPTKINDFNGKKLPKNVGASSTIRDFKRATTTCAS